MWNLEKPFFFNLVMSPDQLRKKSIGSGRLIGMLLHNIAQRINLCSSKIACLLISFVWEPNATGN